MNVKNIVWKTPFIKPSTVHYKEPQASQKLQQLFLDSLSNQVGQPIVLVCIGTDRSTGDSLGPLIGTKLFEQELSAFHLFGTLDHPVHALNLADTLAYIEDSFDNPYIIGIDACLGSEKNIGSIAIRKGPLKPGSAMNKDLPAVGDIHITGTVNAGGFMDFLVLQNTRLSLVMKMADIISSSICQAEYSYRSSC